MRHPTIRVIELLVRATLLLPRDAYDDVTDDVTMSAKDLSKTLRLPLVS